MSQTGTTRSQKKIITLICFIAIYLLWFLLIFHQIEETNPAPTAVLTIANKTVSSIGSGILSDLRFLNADKLFSSLLEEAQEATKKNSSTVLHCMEVGMHSSKQCLQVAKSNLQAHCVEPSPASFKRIHKKISGAQKTLRQKVNLYQLAASNQSGMNLEFSGSGGTGDHVGGDGYDVWAMVKKDHTKEEKVAATNGKVTVRSVAIDDIIDNKVTPSSNFGKEEGGVSTNMTKIDRLYLIKVDTQGHEPSVFSGLQNSIREHKIDLIMTEYWPKGIDFMNDSMGPEKECKIPVSILQPLVDAGYILFTLHPSAHTEAPNDLALKQIREEKSNKNMQWDTLRDHCMWFYDLERTYRDTGGITEKGEVYKMGYWTDILAVRPGFRFPVTPKSRCTKIIENISSKKR